MMAQKREYHRVSDAFFIRENFHFLADLKMQLEDKSSWRKQKGENLFMMNRFS